MEAASLTNGSTVPGMTATRLPRATPQVMGARQRRYTVPRPATPPLVGNMHLDTELESHLVTTRVSPPVIMLPHLDMGLENHLVMARASLLVITLPVLRQVTLRPRHTNMDLLKRTPRQVLLRTQQHLVTVMLPRVTRE